MAEGRAFVPEWRWSLVGLPWGEAQQVLAARGISYTSVVTAPPNRPEGFGEMRVVAERALPEGLLLVLAYREYGRREPRAAVSLEQKGGGGPC